MFIPNPQASVSPASTHVRLAAAMPSLVPCSRVYLEGNRSMDHVAWVVGASQGMKTVRDANVNWMGKLQGCNFGYYFYTLQSLLEKLQQLTMNKDEDAPLVDSIASLCEIESSYHSIALS